jgi:hypothetical protein
VCWHAGMPDVRMCQACFLSHQATAIQQCATQHPPPPPLNLVCFRDMCPAAHKAALPPLTQQHELKLKQLTVSSLALQQKVSHRQPLA